MSKAKKIAESFLKSLLDQGLYKTYKMSIKELAEMMVESFKDEVQFGTVTESYLHKYTTKQLLDMVNKNVADGGMKDEGRAEVVFNIVNLLYQRQREYMAVTGDTNLKPNPDDVDRILFPPKPPKRRPKALPESEFQIDNWEELLIVITDGSGRIGFKKIFDGKPSFESAYTRHYSELGFGQKSIEFLHICATSSKTGSFVFTNRKLKSNVDKALRDHFNMGDNQSIIPHPDKRHHYIPLFRIWHYDEDGNSTY
jgi:hypothetical protein